MEIHNIDHFKLPRNLPVFPLPGVILLPGTTMPFRIFEERYLEMFRDVLASEGYLGMLQPKLHFLQTKENDNFLQPFSPQLYQIGCLGEVVDWSYKNQQYFIRLEGICRFEIEEELSTTKLYRTVVVNYDHFLQDLSEESQTIDRQAVWKFFRKYLNTVEFETVLDKLSPLSDQVLINAMCLSFQLSPPEKQALLEAYTLSERYQILLDLLSMGFNPIENTDQSPDLLV